MILGGQNTSPARLPSHYSDPAPLVISPHTARHRRAAVSRDEHDHVPDAHDRGGRSVSVQHGPRARDGPDAMKAVEANGFGPEWDAAPLFFSFSWPKR